MKTFGAATFMIGLGQALFQFYLLTTGGYWSRFTIADFLAEFHVYGGYGYTWWDQLRNVMLGFEFSFTLLVLGTMLVVSGPMWRAFKDFHAERLVAQAGTRPQSLQRRSS